MEKTGMIGVDLGKRSFKLAECRRMGWVKTLPNRWLVGRVISCLKPRRERDETVAAWIDDVEANADRMRCDLYRHHGKRLKVNRWEPLQTGGVPLVESGCQRIARHQMLPREQSLGRLHRLEEPPRRSSLTIRKWDAPIKVAMP